MKSVLFACDTYGNLASPNGICIKNLTKEAVRRGYQVFVVCKKTSKKESDYEIVDGVNVFRIKPAWIELKINESKQNSLLKKILVFLSSINGALHIFSYPKLYRVEIRRYYKKIKTIVEKYNLLNVVCVYKQIHAVLAGVKIKKHNKQINLITYTLDSISGGAIPTICRSKKIPFKSILKWENLIFKSSDRIFLMESHRNHYTNKCYTKFSQKFTFVDIPLLSKDALYIPKKTFKSNGLDFVFTGSMSLNTANPIPFLRFLKTNRLDFVFTIYGVVANDIKSEITKMDFQDGQIKINGFVPHNQIQEIQKNARILVNFGNSNANMIPCKIFEYLNTGNKILSISPSNKDPSLPYLANDPVSFVITYKDLEKKETIKHLKCFAETQSTYSVKRTNTLFIKCLPEYFFDCLEGK